MLSASYLYSVDHLLQVFQRYWCVVDGFHTDVDVLWPEDRRFMNVTMYIRFEAAQTLRMNRDVGEDDLVQNAAGVHLVKVKQILLDRMVIVVSTYEALVPVAPPYRSDACARHGYIAQVIDLVTRSHHGVPAIDHVVIHVLNGREIPYGHSLLIAKVQEVCVSKVSVRHDKDVCHLDTF